MARVKQSLRGNVNTGYIVLTLTPEGRWKFTPKIKEQYRLTASVNQDVPTEAEEILLEMERSGLLEWFEEGKEIDLNMGRIYTHNVRRDFNRLAAIESADAESFVKILASYDRTQIPYLAELVIAYIGVADEEQRERAEELANALIARV